jgi:hypothetical protein
MFRSVTAFIAVLVIVSIGNDAFAQQRRDRAPRPEQSCTENRTPYGFCLPTPSQDGWSIRCEGYTYPRVCGGMNQYGTELVLYVGDATRHADLSRVADMMQRIYAVDNNGQPLSILSRNEQRGTATLGGEVFEWLHRSITIGRAGQVRNFILFKADLPGGRLLLGDLRQTNREHTRDMHSELFTVMSRIRRIPVVGASN